MFSCAGVSACSFVRDVVCATAHTYQIIQSKYKQDQDSLSRLILGVYNQVSFCKIIEVSDRQGITATMSGDEEARIYGLEVFHSEYAPPSSYESPLCKQDLGYAVSIHWTHFAIYHVNTMNPASKMGWNIARITHLPARQLWGSNLSGPVQDKGGLSFIFHHQITIILQPVNYFDKKHTEVGKQGD